MAGLQGDGQEGAQEYADKGGQKKKYIEEGLKKEWEALGVDPYEHVLARVNGQLMRWVKSAVPPEADGRGESREAPIEIK